MRVAIFTQGNENDDRMVRIEIDSSFISFYFDEEEYEFYWIGNDDWINHSKKDLDAPQNWVNHMKRKRWFTDKMLEFIDKCLNISR